ncbi:UDP-N-acetylmuramate dehydrogenase [Pseudonocardia sp. GCM10023141]|uniref:UDP-N-acetylmuramate dehydrogenase n=1 Tax=Pseudonocardia sp. GCM10023141 TaxID=3252653 RepID=UPI00360BD5AE
MTAPDVATSLAALTTLRLGGPARRFVEADTAAEVVEAVRSADAAGERLLLLGGGSNVVVSDDGWPGTVVRVASTGRRVDRRPDGSLLLTVEAGAGWDDVVAGCVADGIGGLECLSGIPGRTGATPVQNVGAYGVEVAELIVDVDLYERRTGTVREHVPVAELGLAYRTSALKGRSDAVVLRVRFVLPGDDRSAPIRYAELARTLGVAAGERVHTATARAAVLQLRRDKGMVLDEDDHDTWSVGSFFTNPVVAESEAPPDAPRWPAGAGMVKLPAAWLIEHSGFTRGRPGPGGRVGLSSRHVLALTNRGGGRTVELLALAADIRSSVCSTFGVVLVPEPVLVECAL